MSQNIKAIKPNEDQYRSYYGSSPYRFFGPNLQGPSILLSFDKDTVVKDGGRSCTDCDGEKFSSCTSKFSGFTFSFKNISIPFTSAVPMRGIYILANNNDGPPSLDIKFTHSDGKVTSRNYEFESHGKKDRKQSNGEYYYSYTPSASFWHYLPVDLSVVKCEIEGRGMWEDYYPKAGATKTSIREMFFVRGETARETELRELVEKKSTEMVCLHFLSVPMRGIYILANNNDGPPSLDIKFTHSDGKVTSRNYEFESHGKKDRKQSNGEYYYSYTPSASFWHYLPVDLSVVKCEIEGRGMWEDYYPKAGATKTSIREMFFVRGETARETELRELVEKKSTEMLILKSEFLKEGDSHNPPISYSDPTILLTNLKRVSGEDEDERALSRPFDMTPSLQGMLKGEELCWFSYLSLPFYTAVPELKGAYIYSPKYGEKVWHFLRIFLYDVVKCEILGGCKEGSRGLCGCSSIHGMIFVREESFGEKVNRETFLFPPVIKIESSSRPNTHLSAASLCNPSIPYSDPTIIPLPIDEVSGCDDNWGKQSLYYDKSDDIQGILRGEPKLCLFSQIHIPFASPISHLEGVYVCCDHYYGPRSLILRFTEERKVSSKRFSLPEPKNRSEWIFLPIDLPNVVCCDITAGGTWTDEDSRRSYLDGLIFVRAETPKELQDRKDRKKSISAAPSITSTLYSHKDRQHPPVALDSTQTIPLNVAGSIACDDSFCKESDRFDRSSTVRRMLRGECCASFSHLSIPFQDKCCPKGVYICFKQNKKTPAFRFVFTHSDGKQTFMKCAVEDLEHKHE
ncbi:hypothetical protein ADUPG1_005944, partial [Aduncisulcus paluster]